MLIRTLLWHFFAWMIFLSLSVQAEFLLYKKGHKDPIDTHFYLNQQAEEQQEIKTVFYILAVYQWPMISMYFNTMD